MPVLKNVKVVVSRVTSPRPSRYGPQYSLLVSGVPPHVKEMIGGGDAQEEGSCWLNWPAEFPNGDAVPLMTQIRNGQEVKEPTELGRDSELDLAFQQSKDGKYYNLRAIRINKFMAPLSALDWFDDETFDSATPDDQFDSALEF